MEAFTQAVITIIKRIPRGKVCSYGQVAAMAGQPAGARQVVRIIHAMSRKYHLPWHRLINGKGHISLPKSAGYEEQKMRLQMEGVIFGEKDQVNFADYLWKPKNIKK